VGQQNKDGPCTVPGYF